MLYLPCIVKSHIILRFFLFSIINRTSQRHFLIAGSTGFGFTPHIIAVKPGEVTSLSFVFPLNAK